MRLARVVATADIRHLVLTERFAPYMELLAGLLPSVTLLRADKLVYSGQYWRRPPEVGLDMLAIVRWHA
jgi:hypothetical protein